MGEKFSMILLELFKNCLINNDNDRIRTDTILYFYPPPTLIAIKYVLWKAFMGAV